MAQSEFDIIEHYFNRQPRRRADVILGIGDDAAVLAIPPDRQLVVALDTLVSGVHFPVDTAAEDIGYKALAVNLSDLAAMGAEPAWFTLGLTLSESDPDWLRGFAQGLFGLADQFNVQLVGGDTTQGPTTLSIQVAGYVPQGHFMQRTGAKVGDLVFVTGTLGDAALGLQCLQRPAAFAYDAHAVSRLNRPQPRVAFGQGLREFASACIDVSDGLLADLTHILSASHVGARLERGAMPLSEGLRHLCQQDERHYALALSGGDDYELCFCVPAEQQAAVQALARAHDTPVSLIGRIEAQPGLRVFHDGVSCAVTARPGYQHFTG